MDPRIKALIEKKQAIFEELKQINDAAEKESRDLNAEEQGRWDRGNADIDKLTDEINEIEAASKREARAAFLAKLDEDTKANPGRPSRRALDRDDPITKATERTTPDARETRAREAYRRYLTGDCSPSEVRAMQADSPTVGGYLVAPISWQNELIKFVDNETFMRRICRVMQLTGADSIGFPSWDTDPADPTWTSEILAGSEDSSVAVGSRSLTPRPMASYIKVSNTLLRKSTLGVDTLVQQRLGYKAGIVMENAFLNGTGSEQPLGVFTASTSGIPTTQDVSTDNTTGAITADGLINCKYSLKSQYQAVGSWIFHRTAVRNIRKLKDADGQYLWQTGIANDMGSSETLLGRPIYQSEYCPVTFTQGLYVGIFGDFSKYLIVDALTATIQVVDQLYAAQNQTGFFLRAECDGMPVLSEAFARVTLA